MIHPMTLKLNKTYWFLNSHNAVFNFNMISLNVIENANFGVSFYLIKGDDLYSICNLKNKIGKNSASLNVRIPLD